MKNFKCQHCGQVLYFENTLCEVCGHRLGYIVESATLSALEPDGDSSETGGSESVLWRALAPPGQQYRLCANAQYDVCNWLVPAEAPDRFCAACRHNGTIPDLTVAENRVSWAKLEIAKHRLFYTLLKLRLKIANRNDDPEHGLLFDFLADAPTPDGPR